MSDIRKVIYDLKKMGVKLRTASEFLKSKQEPYKGEAKAIVDREVYFGHVKDSAKPWQTGATHDSVDTDMPDKNTLRVFINPALGNPSERFPNLRSFYNMTGQGGYKYYPAYAMWGIFFKQKQAPRNFLEVWRKEIGQQFINDVKHEVA